MKIISFILIFFTLSLSLAPCADDVEDIAIETQQSDDDANQSDHSDDYCSPFCMCACCGVVIVFNSTEIEKKEHGELFLEHQFNYNSAYTKSYYTSIWHPPTLR